MADRESIVFVVSGPSGSGKSTLVQKLLDLPGMMLSISATTRPPRSTENHGKWYDFVSEADFERMVREGAFLEHARLFGRHSYGTPRKWLDEARAKNLDLVLEIDVQGAAQIRKKVPGAVSIFILPPSREELERRIRERGQDSADEIARRLRQARLEMESFSLYDFIVVNDDLERAGREVQAIGLGTRCRSGIARPSVERILKTFEGERY
ncbi:MAG: guanylate kinase [Candidatus Acidiferrales bacterium]